MAQEQPSDLLNEGVTLLEKGKKINLADETVQARIRTEVAPVLTQLSDVMNDVAVYIATPESQTPQRFEMLRRRFLTSFMAYGCAVAYEVESHFTDIENPASLQWNEATKKINLYVSQEFKDPSIELKGDFLKEMIHELGALSLIDIIRTKINFPLESASDLKLLKRMLLFNESDKSSAYTHLIDAVLLVMIKRLNG